MFRNIWCRLWVAAMAMCVLGCSSAATLNGSGNPDPSGNVNYQLQRATDGIHVLQDWYDPSTGLYRTTGWWNSANAITVLINYARVSKSTQYNADLANTFQAAQKTSPGFLNNFYDDEGWWALAWIDAYDLTGDRQYLLMAQSIFADMTSGWDGTCGGGIWWSKDRSYKNAIANELFLSVAAHLANRASPKGGEYLAWANKEWKWFAQSGMINTANLINDGLAIAASPTGTASCSNNGGTTWTYNQGVVLGGLSELAMLNPDPSIRQAAQNIATAAITYLVDGQGVLHDPCEARCGADGVQFKGIFVRNLLALNQAQSLAEYESFITTNAAAIWNDAQGPKFQLGQVWSGPFDAGNAGSQSSALDALIAAATLQNAK